MNSTGASKQAGFQRQVPPLATLCLRAAVAATERALTPVLLQRAAMIVAPSEPLAHRVTQKLVDALEGAGRLQDAALPAELFPPNLTTI